MKDEDFRFAPERAFAGYTIEAPLGAGSAGETYRARRSGTSLVVALKIAWPQLASMPGFARAMQRQGGILQKLRHPLIVPVLDAGTSEGLPFRASGFVAGPQGAPLTLRDQLRERLAQGRPFEEDQVFALARGLIEAIAAWHGFRDAELCPDGAALGDLRPADLLSDADMTFRLGDPGLHALVHAATREAPPPGLPPPELDHMAPEVRDGVDPDARSDVYSFGATVYEALTGQRFAPGSQPPSHLRKDIRPGWDGILMKRCLVANPDDRLADLVSLRKVIENLAATPGPKPESSGQGIVPQVPDLPAMSAEPPKGDPPPAGGATAAKVVKKAPLKKTRPVLPPPKTRSSSAPLRPALKAAPAKPAREAGPGVAPAAPAVPRKPAKKKVPVKFITSGIMVLVAAVLFGVQKLSKKETPRPAGAPVASAPVPAAPAPVAPAPKSAPAPVLPADGQPWVLEDLGITLKWIPAGKVLLGSGAEDREAIEKSISAADKHSLGYEAEAEGEIAGGFWIAESEVTVAQWKKYMAGRPGFKTSAELQGSAYSVRPDGSIGSVSGANWRNPIPGEKVETGSPVTCVRPPEAEDFCAWLTQRERAAGRLPAGLAYRLPTETEWVHACRGGAKTRTTYWWGSDPDSGAGRVNAAGGEFSGRYAAAKSQAFAWSDQYPHLAPVNAFGAKGRNEFGVADMLGNVWECVMKPRTGKFNYAWCGGSFAEGPSIVRCASIRHRYTDRPSANAGFRVCLGRE